MSHPASLGTIRSLKTMRALDIIRRYNQGEPVQSIADRYEMARTQVRQIARDAGLPARPKHFPEKVKNAVLKDYASGLPIAKIAEKHAVSQAYVSKTAGEAGIQRVPR